METAKTAIPDIQTAPSIEQVVKNADAVLILTEWSEFTTIKWKSLLPSMRAPVVIDFRNLYDLDEMAETGAAYYSLGRPIGLVN